MRPTSAIGIVIASTTCALAAVLICNQIPTNSLNSVDAQQFQLNASSSSSSLTHKLPLSTTTKTTKATINHDHVKTHKTANLFEQISNYITSPTGASLVGQDANKHDHISPEAIRGNFDSLSSSMLKTYIRTNNMKAYTLDLHSYRPGAKFIGDPKFVSSLNAEHKLRCSRHLKAYELAIKSFNELDPILDRNFLDSLRLADVFGRPEAGVLFGNQYWLGSYDNCKDIRIRIDQNEAVQSHYCLGISQFPNWNPQDGKTSIKIGLCLPETCTSSMLSDDDELLIRVEQMMKMSFGTNLPYDRLKLRQVYCMPHETSEVRRFSNSAICFLFVVGSLISLSVICTVIDHYNEKQLAEQATSDQHEERTWKLVLVESFSISKNLQKFLRLHPDDEQVIILDPNNVMGTYNRSRFLNSINGLKCLGLMWIICAHTFLVTPIPEKNLINLDKATQTYLASVYMTAHLMVDTFFALSGMLASFFLFREGLDKIKTSGWIALTLHRYWRLTPIYLLCYWFTKSIGHLINDGPLWDYMTSESSPRLKCAQESWSEALFHLSDFKSPKDHCVPFAWFIANGIKFWIVTPIFLLSIHKSMRRGYLTTLGAILANIMLVTILAYNSNVDVKAVIEFRPESAENMLNEMGQTYTRPYSRIGAYLVGLLAGHLMFLVDSNQLEIKISKNAKIIAWTLFSVVVVALTFLLKIAAGIELDEVAMRYVFSICSGLVRPIWAVATCWLVFALAHGQVRWLSRFLSANFFKTMVKLSFCAYLIQGEVLAQIYLSKSNSETFNYIDMISRPIVTIVMTVVVSFVMVILFEYPLVEIEELILPKRNKNSSINLAKNHQHERLKTPGEKLKST